MNTKLHAAIYNNYCPINALKTLGVSGNKQYYSDKCHFNLRKSKWQLLQGQTGKPPQRIRFFNSENESITSCIQMIQILMWIVSNNEREDAEINKGTSKCTVFNSLYFKKKSTNRGLITHGIPGHDQEFMPAVAFMFCKFITKACTSSCTCTEV